MFGAKLQIGVLAEGKGAGGGGGVGERGRKFRGTRLEC